MRTETPSDLIEITQIFAALGDPTRLELITRLGSGEPRSIAHLAQGLAISHQGVTKHLRVLESAGLVESVKRGREKHYFGIPSRVDNARGYLDQVSARWDVALERIKHLAES